jgi:hypothetical protein
LSLVGGYKITYHGYGYSVAMWLHLKIVYL